MDLTFHCPHCQQELMVDASAGGQVIQCPTCNSEIGVPMPDVTNIRPHNPIHDSAAAKVEHHFVVPVHEGPPEPLIPQKKRDEEVSEGLEKKVKIRIFRHSDCIEVGHDRYEEFVSAFLNKVGWENVLSTTTLNYTHIDIATQKILTDYAIQIIYRG
jgi:DNA-directed RNA polymerase subunit M/transcription elongation factor TFIIS